jgi:uncharacterized protein
MARLFIDTGYALALALGRDQHHARASELAREFDRSDTRFVTTSAVLLEIGNSLSSPALRPTALRILDGLRGDRRVEIIETGEGLVRRGLDLFRERTDKEWSLTDCISFVIMGDERLSLALTYDQHFEQAGFTALMRG